MDVNNYLLSLTCPVLVRDALSAKVQRASLDDRPSLKELLDPTVFAVFDKEQFLGLVSASQVATYPGRILADLILKPPPPPLSPDTPLMVAKRRLEQEKVDALPVVDREGRFYGAVTLTSVLEALLKEEARLKEEGRAALEYCRKEGERLKAALCNSQALYAAGRRLLEVAFQGGEQGAWLQTALELLCTLVAARYGALVLLDGEGKVAKFYFFGIDPETAAKIGRLPEGKGLLGPKVLGKYGTLRLENLAAHPEAAGFPLHHPVMRNLVAAEISSDGQKLGRVYLCDRQDGEPFTAEDELEVRRFAELLALTLIEREKHARLEWHQKLASRVFDQSSEGILITNTKTEILYVNPALIAITGYSKEELIGKTPRIFQSGYHDKKFYRNMWQSLKETGQWQGEVWNRRKSGEVYPEWLRISAIVDDQGQVSHYVAVFMDLSQSPCRKGKGIERLAHFDHLTDLPNRLTFCAELKQAMLRTRFTGKLAGLILLDLDRFKPINDYFGHQVGDCLLQQVAKRLRGAVRKLQAPRIGDVVARLSGDEFAVILSELKSPEDGERIAAKILQRFAEPFQLGSFQRQVSASLGLAFYPGDAETLDDWIRHADFALYHAKRSGAKLCRYNGVLHAVNSRRMRLEHALHQALARGEFALYYQPQVEIKSGKVRGFEALLRWSPPEFGAISPAEFVPLLEEMGLIEEVGEWTLAQVLTAYPKLCTKFGAGIWVAVNVSLRQLNERFAGFLKTLALGAVSLECLKLELTESVALEQSEGSLKLLAELNHMGIEIWIDDFGTGYSSLSYLTRLPIAGLKIDKSFVSNMLEKPADLAVVSSIIALGQSLGLKVLAEGVETEAQADKLKALGCELAQGYLFGKPAPLEALLKEALSS